MQQSRVTLKAAEDAAPSESQPVAPPIMAALPRKLENVGGREYKYFTEISQMMFVFGEVQDPMPETVNLVEDIVRSQIIELVSSLRIGLWPAAERRADIAGPDAGLAPWGPLPLRRRPYISHSA